MKRSLFVLSSLIVLSLASCNGGSPIDNSGLTPTEVTDNYRTIYQIFPISFADSNGDKQGDLKGIENKLDYISNLNYDGIWMTPVCPSPTYHKYDITDYYNIDPVFGDLAAFDSMVKKAHEKKMSVIFDLVFNHTSDSHPWFKECCQAHLSGDTSNRYYDYYNIVESGKAGAYYAIPGSGGTLFYEARFWSGMPDLNLQSVLDDPEGPLATELKKIISFWLKDHDVDGFRLDAVTSYFTGQQDKNTEFLTWLNNQCRAIKKDCYIVGEGSWNANAAENKAYQASGVDSFFNFANKDGAKKYGLPYVALNENAENFADGMERSWDTAANGIPANFVGNHDIGRLAGVVGGRANKDAIKFGHTLLSILPGAVFGYYGDETGMATPINKAGDPDYRLHVEWGDSYTCQDPVGHCNYDKETTYLGASVAEQLKDQNSLINHVAKANFLRKLFPEIARGKTELLDAKKMENDGVTMAVISKKTKDSEIAIAINPSLEKSFDYNVSFLEGYTPKAELAIKGNSTYSGSTLHLAPGGVVVLAKA